LITHYRIFLLVGSWLFCIQHFPCDVSFWCTLGVGVEVWSKHILYQFIEGHIHFSTSWHAKRSLALNELI
jgi:hypothetical protein